MLGHNNGPPIGDITDVGGLMRQYCWRKAHKKAWRTPPIEIVKLRYQAAAQLGLSYRDYTAILMDRGHRPSAIFFDLGGTLVRTRNNEVHTGIGGTVTLMPGVRRKLQRLSGCSLFIIASGELTHETVDGHIRQIGELSGSKLSGWTSREPDMVNGLLAKHGIPPSQAILVGDTVEDERCAERAKLARFFWAWHYFGDTSMGSA
jgi:hypothetical protein